MFMPKGGGEMEMPAQDKEGAVEELKGLQMELLTGETLPQYQGFIESMKYNALDRSKNRALFVMKDGERVVGFVALRVHPEDRTGYVERIWHSDPHHQANALAQMLKTSEKYFRDHHCDKGVIEAPEMSRELTRVSNRYRVEEFYSVENGEDDEPKIVGERGGK